MELVEEPEEVPLDDGCDVLVVCACKLNAAANSADVPHVISFPSFFMGNVVD